MSDPVEHEVIFLEPFCDGCNGYEGRMWCELDHGPCEECGRAWVRYSRAGYGKSAHPESILNTSDPIGDEDQ